MPRMEDYYKETVVPQLNEQFGYTSAMQVPKISKITLNMGIGEAAGDTFLVAGICTIVALVLTVGCLEAEHRFGHRMTRRATLLLYLPLLVPQTAFLPGLQTFLLSINADTGRAPVIAAHLVFVLPYVFLSLGDPWRAWDTRYGTVAAGLGASASRVLWAVRLPMLLGPLLTALLLDLLLGGGLTALQAMVNATGIIFTVVLLFLCWSILQGLRSEPR